MPIDWHQFRRRREPSRPVIDSRRRLRICLAAFVLALLAIFARAVQLEVSGGSAFRDLATRPLKRERSLPGVRGRILARDGTVLARDREILALAVHYRRLQQPADPRWLRRTARLRLEKDQRKDDRLVAAEQRLVLKERSEQAGRLAELCGLAPGEWNRRAARILARVERIVSSVRRRRGAGITIAEQFDYHVMAEDVPITVVAEIEGHPKDYPGVKVLPHSRRNYPSATLAANVLGHLGRVNPKELDDERAAYRAEDFVGRMGLERQYESLLRGRHGVAVELTDHGGNLLSSHCRRRPGIGRDLILTLDGRLQRAAETLLDAALQRRQVGWQRAGPGGGAIVVIDVHTGALLTAASAPRFDPNLFVAGTAGRLDALLTDQSRPLFDRASRMAIPPGSVFKIVSAAALLQSDAVDPHEPFVCQGYLKQPDRQRCAIYVQRGIGHGETTLGDALTVSCNVYFFHHCGRLGADPLVDWARRFGFARATGVDLPGEAAGTVPSPSTIRSPGNHSWRPGDTESLAIGQGALTATPLQVGCMMAAVANGGRLPLPHLVSRLGLPQLAEGETPPADDPIRIRPPQAIPGLHGQTLAAIRSGLQRVVSDRQGTAFATVRLQEVAIAGKTGTAETGGGRAAHAWFAGYVPADDPKFAFVVALQHAGDGATAAGPVARRLVQRMQQLGLL